MTNNAFNTYLIQIHEKYTKITLVELLDVN